MLREERRAPRQRVEPIEIERGAGAAGHRDEMNDRVGRSAERHRGRDRVLERLGRQDLARRQVLPHHLDDAAAARGRPSARCAESAAGIDDAPGSVMPSASDRRRHRRRRAHRHARAERAGDAVFHLAPGALVERAGAPLGPVLPDVAAASRGSARASCRGASGRPARRSPGGSRWSAPITQRRHRLVAAAEQDRAVGGVRRAALPRPPSPAGCDRASCSAS